VSTAVALKTNPGRPQDVELLDFIAAVTGGGAPQPLYWGRTEPPADHTKRRRDELALVLLGVL